MIRSDYLATCDAVRTLIATDAVAAAWDAPSALDRMTVGALTGHVLRAVTSVDRYLAEGSPGPGSEVDAPGYFLSVGDLADDLDSELHAGIRQRAAAEAEGGPGAVVDRWDDAFARVRGHLDTLSPDTRVAVFGGRLMLLDEYLVTRLVELLVHGDDLAASLDSEPPAFLPSAFGRVIDCLVEVAVRRHGPAAVVTALTRRERDAVNALRVL